MAGTGDARVTATATEWRTESRYYRRPPGWLWLLGLLLLPLLLGWIAWGALGLGRPKIELPSINVSAPSLTVPSISVPSVALPSFNFSPLSIVRSGNNFTLSGDLPDLSVKASLMDALKAAFPGANFIDNLNIKAGIPALDFSGLSALFKAAVDIPDFNYKIEGSTITLTGTAPSEDVKAAVEAAAKAAWPNLSIVNNIEVKGGASVPATTSGGGAVCDNLQAAITAALTAPINFQTDGFTLTPATQQELTVVAQKLKGCTSAKVAVTGHTDNTGNDAINNPLSASRAKSVGDYLASQGIPAAEITTNGVGSSQPVAGNDSEAGRAKNRRVDITVS